MTRACKSTSDSGRGCGSHGQQDRRAPRRSGPGSPGLPEEEVRGDGRVSADGGGVSQVEGEDQVPRPLPLLKEIPELPSRTANGGLTVRCQEPPLTRLHRTSRFCLGRSSRPLDQLTTGYRGSTSPPQGFGD